MSSFRRLKDAIKGARGRRAPAEVDAPPIVASAPALRESDTDVNEVDFAAHSDSDSEENKLDLEKDLDSLKLSGSYLLHFVSELP